MEHFEHIHLEFTDDLNAIEILYRQAIEPLDEKVLSDKDKWYAHVVNLPKHLQVVYTVGLYNWSVLNDGHREYFYNRYGMFAHLTIQNLKLLNAEEASIILSFALEQVNHGKLQAAEFRTAIFNQSIKGIADDDEELESMLEILDEKYRALGDEPTYDRLEAYARHFV